MDETEKKELLDYVATIRQFCEALDSHTKQMSTLDETIKSKQADLNNKKNYFSKERLPFLYVLSMLIVAIPVSLINLLLPTVQMSYCIPFAGFGLLFAAKRYYEIKKLPPIQKTADNNIKNLKKDMSEKIDTLYLYIEYFPEIFKDIPEELRYTIALDFIYWSIHKDYFTTLEDAIAFYNEQIKKITEDNDERWASLKKDIKKSIESMNFRNDVIKKTTKTS